MIYLIIKKKKKEMISKHPMQLSLSSIVAEAEAEHWPLPSLRPYGIPEPLLEIAYQEIENEGCIPNIFPFFLPLSLLLLSNSRQPVFTFLVNDENYQLKRKIKTKMNNKLYSLH